MILCCGEALIDLIPDHNASGDPVLRPLSGGSVFNTAIALGRLGQETGFLSGLSTDRFGRQLVQDLEDAGVDHRLSIRTHRPTSLAVVNLENGEAIYSFYDEGSAGRLIEASDIPAIPPDVSTLLFGGISLISEPCGATFEKLLTEKSQDHLIYLDPNIRPNFIIDDERHRARIKRMIAYSDIVKVSIDDLSWIEPDADPEIAIGSWMKDKPSIVLLSLGKDGSRVYRDGNVIEATAPKIQVIDTVGAGDTFNAGFLAALNNASRLNRSALKLLSDEILLEALRFANHAASITASRVGANPPLLEALALA